MSQTHYATDGTRLTDCCGAYSTYDIDSGDLVCRACYTSVPDGQGDGIEQATLCFHCRLPVTEPERRVISRERGFYAHLTPSCCAIATIRAREATREPTA